MLRAHLPKGDIYTIPCLRSTTALPPTSKLLCLLEMPRSHQDLARRVSLLSVVSLELLALSVVRLYEPRQVATPAQLRRLVLVVSQNLACSLALLR